MPTNKGMPILNNATFRLVRFAKVSNDLETFLSFQDWHHARMILKEIPFQDIFPINDMTFLQSLEKFV